jgi:choice-of-anchor B domain-containing protein
MKKYLFIIGFLIANWKVSAQLNISYLANLDYPENISNIWGWTAPGGEEYVILGSYEGTYLIDITTPTAPDELQFINGANSTWRQISTWSHYAYVVNESGDGLLCIDMSTLPATASYAFSDGGVGLTTAHQVWADENGYVYVFGSNLYGGSTVILDANANPLDPVFVGATDTWYVHHGFVRGDTLYESNIYEGWFSVWDVTDKSLPVLLATQETPGTFTHNVVPSDDGQFLFSTDEKSNGSLGAYDISDLSDIQFQSEFRANPGTSSIPHYAWYFDGFVVTAWYKDGVIITDVTHPELMVKTGYYDTYAGGGSGFSGAWGCYPYFPSGTLVVSDIQSGLFVLDPTYVKACYLEGNITDESTGAALFGATVTITADLGSTVSTTISGDYITATLTPGLQSVTISKPGYATKTVNRNFTSGGTIVLNVALEPVTATCEMPGLLVAEDITESSVHLDWNNVGATNYTVMYRKVGGTAMLQTTANTYLDITGLESCSTYKWRVRANCSDGSKPKSAQLTFVTGGGSCRVSGFDMADNGAVVFPNPMTETVYVSAPNEEDITLIELYDLSGLLVQRLLPAEDNFGLVQLNTGNLPAGRYIVRCFAGDNIFTEQVVR